MEQVEEIWRNAGYSAAARLWALVKTKGLGVTAKQVKEFVDAQETMQLQKRAPKDTKSHHITSAGNALDFQADLLDMQRFKGQNRGHSWCLLVEDIFNRRAAMKAIRTKSPEDVKPALEAAFRELGTPKVTLTTDQGNEFKASVERFLEQKGVVHHTAEVGDHRVLGVIDSLSRFVKNAVHKHFTHSQTTNWIDYLPTLEKSYNETPHSSLKGMTPNEAEERPTDTRNIAYDQVMKDKKPEKFNVGQTVRVLKRKQNPFTKGYEIRYSIPTYTIESIDGKYYVLSNNTRHREGDLQAVKAVAKAKEAAAEEQEERKEEEARPAAAERRDVSRQAKFEHRTGQILQHREGVQQQNRREGLRERKPESQLMHEEFGRVRW